MAEKAALTTEDLAELLAIVLIETVAAVVPDSKTADNAIEDITGHLLDFYRKLPSGPVRNSLFLLCQKLAGTDEGSGL